MDLSKAFLRDKGRYSSEHPKLMSLELHLGDSPPPFVFPLRASSNGFFSLVRSQDAF